MDAQGIVVRLRALVGDVVGELVVEGTKDPFCRVKPEAWHDVALRLRDDAELAFDFLQCVTATDWPARQTIEVVYHLYSYRLRHSFVVKADLPRAQPSISSVSDVWPVAEWNEREQFDLVGVDFPGHPDLRRLLLPEDWLGHPLRKDYQEAASYRGMSTSRPSPLDLLVQYDKAHGGRRP